MLTAEGLVVLGAFDGYVHAYDRALGEEQWSLATRDHVYARRRRASPDGSIVVPSADGSVYDLDRRPARRSGSSIRRDPIRSSPSVDADEATSTLAAGTERLYVVRADGKLRWSILLIDADRNDLNSSPALGTNAIYLGGESGQVFSVPYEYCLRGDAGKRRRALRDGGPSCASPAGPSLPCGRPSFGSAARRAARVDRSCRSPITLIARRARQGEHDARDHGCARRSP